jgi:hypothetical protein
MTEAHRSRPCFGLGPVALSVFAVLSLGACTGDPPIDGPAAADLAPPASDALRGEVVIYTATYDDGTSDQQFYLRVGERSSDERRLLFAVEPDASLIAGTRIDVWGVPAGDALQVSRYQVVRPAIGEQQQGLVTSPPAKPRRFAFVLVDIGGGVNLTEAEATRKLFATEASTTPSVRQYYMEASYGHQDVGGQVFGPIKYAMQGCNTRGLADTIRPMIQGTFDHYLWYIGSRVTACQWSGLASSGSPAKPTRDTWYNASSGCVVLVQEPGHNFGMAHSSSMKCNGNVPFLDVPMDNCVHSEYGDSYDPMGRGCRHMNAGQKVYLGWFGKCNVVAPSANATFNLVPLELPCDGIQALQIKMPKVRPFFRSGGGGQAGITELTDYFVEMRAPLGLDKTVMPSVQIRASTDTRASNQRGAHTWFLDMNPATAALDGLTAGGTFADPGGGVKITVMSIDATHASVKLEFPNGGSGDAKCLDDSTIVAPGPGAESCAMSPFAVNGPPPVLPDGGTGGLVDAGGRTDARSGTGGSSGGTADAAVAYDAPVVADAEITGGKGGSSGSQNGSGGKSGSSPDAKPASSGTGGDQGTIGGNDPDPGTQMASGSSSGCSLGGPRPAAGSFAGFAVLALLGAIGSRRRRR